MPPANIFHIFCLLVNSVLTALVRRGSDKAFSTRLYGKYVAEEHTFFQAGTTILYLYSIDLLILQERGGAAKSFFELRHVEHGQMCMSGAFTKATTSVTRAAIQCASRDPNRTTVV